CAGDRFRRAPEAAALRRLPGRTRSGAPHACRACRPAGGWRRTEGGGGGMIEGLSHITFIVRDLERMAAILTGVLGAVEAYSSGDARFSLSRGKFFPAGGVWIAAMEGEPLPARS